jgi:hypothetical protein
VNHRADLWNLRTSHTSLREELTKQLPLKDDKKILLRFPNHLERLRQIFCLNTNTGLDDEGVTQELLRLKFYCS